MTRLSPAAKDVAVAMADTPEEKQSILDLPILLWCGLCL